MEQKLKDLIKSANDWLDKTFSPNGKKLFLVIVALLIVASVIFAISFTQNKSNNDDFDMAETEVPTVTPKKEKVKEVDIDIESDGDTMVSVAVEDVGRANPFLPDSESVVVTRPTSMNGYSLMAPPETLREGSEASRVMTTKVSGILYDAIKPSAILNIEGNDYLVRTGDYIHNYKVLSISKDLVTVQLGKNVYKAGVGEMMADATLNYNTVYDLQHRFGGAKK